MLRWGILGVSRFAARTMIPALQRGAGMTVAAIASRSLDKAAAAARELGIPRAYGSYEELLGDPEIDAVYNPLPNHLHLPMSVKAAEAGKHVLCEKPIALNAAEARALLAARDRAGVLVQEAAMVRVHPRWLAARELVRHGKIGELRAMQGRFCYDMRRRDDVRYRPEMGGGTLLDVGFYPITMARFMFDAEPARVVGTLERDPESGVDRLVSAILEFPRGEFAGGQATFTCGMQLPASQYAALQGTAGRIEVETPWNPPADRPTRLIIDRSATMEAPEPETITFDPCNQHTLLAETFAQAVKSGAPAPVPLEDSVKNMAVIDAIFRSAETGRWEIPAT